MDLKKYYKLIDELEGKEKQDAYLALKILTHRQKIKDLEISETVLGKKHKHQISILNEKIKKLQSILNTEEKLKEYSMKDIDNSSMPLVDKKRLEKNYSVRAFCEVIGITTPTYYNYLRNKTRIPVEVLSKMETVLDIKAPEIAQNGVRFHKNLVPPPLNILRNVV